MTQLFENKGTFKNLNTICLEFKKAESSMLLFCVIDGYQADFYAICREELSESTHWWIPFEMNGNGIYLYACYFHAIRDLQIDGLFVHSGFRSFIQGIGIEVASTPLKIYRVLELLKNVGDPDSGAMLT
jgi:hypothetical protein